MSGYRKDKWTRRPLRTAAALSATLLFSACINASGVSGSGGGDVGAGITIPAGGASVSPTPLSNIVQVSEGETSPTAMFLNIDQATAVAGEVRFEVTNGGADTHEFVVLRTDTPAGELPIVGFEGESDRISEDAPGVKNVGETGDLKAGEAKTLRLTLKPGHYALVCNLQHHYAMGMHIDFVVT